MTADCVNNLGVASLGLYKVGVVPRHRRRVAVLGAEQDDGLIVWNTPSRVLDAVVVGSCVLHGSFSSDTICGRCVR